MLLRCISAFKFPFVNYSLIRGRNDHQNVSKFSPYRVGQFVTKNRAYFFLKFVKWIYIQDFAGLMTLCSVLQE